MEEYLVPTAFGQAEFIEKKSRFIGHIWPTESEAEALAHIEEMRKLHYDATHNVWAYIIKDGPVRFSDDGEPGGTAGMPTLQVLQRENLFHVTCVVTRRRSPGGRRAGPGLCQGSENCRGRSREVHEAGMDLPVSAGSL